MDDGAACSLEGSEPKASRVNIRKLFDPWIGLRPDRYSPISVVCHQSTACVLSRYSRFGTAYAVE